MAACTRRRRSRVDRGFTLTELLIVMAILAILLGILAPTFTQLRTQVIRLLCHSNLRQMGLGMQGYVNAYSAYPAHCSALRHGYPYAVWPTRIRRYLAGDLDVFFCPAHDDGFRWQKKFGVGNDYADSADVAEWFYEPGERMLYVHATPFSYAYNDWGNNRAGPTVNQRGLGGDLRSMVAVNELPMRGVADPANMIAIGDSQQTGSWDFNLDPGDPWEYPGRIHDGGANMLFCDGHVEWGLQTSWTNVNVAAEAGRENICRWQNNNYWANEGPR